MTVGITELPPEGMQLPGVALAGDTDRGTKTTEGISLLFTTAGITVQGPQPQIERLLVWTALDSATCREVVQLSDGRDAAILELTSGGQSIRFLLPSNTVSPGQAAYLDQALPTWLARYKGVMGPVAPGSAAAEAVTATADEVGVALPQSGPVTSPAPSFVTAGAMAATAGAGAMAFDRSGGGGPTGGQGGQGGQGSGSHPASPPMTGQSPSMTGQPPAPTAQSPAPTAQSPAPPLLSAPSPITQVPPPSAPSAGVPPTAPFPPATAWDDPPLAQTISNELMAPAKKSRFALTRRKAKDADAASATADATMAAAAGAAAATGADAAIGATAPATGLPDEVRPDEVQSATKSSWFTLRRKAKPAASDDGAGSVSADATPAMADAGPPPITPPSSTAPLAVQPPPPAMADAGPAPITPPSSTAPLAVQPPPPNPAGPVAGPIGHSIPPWTGTGAGTGAGADAGPAETADVVLADSEAASRRPVRLALVAILVVVVIVGAGYLVSTRKSTSVSTPPASLTPAQAAAADTATAGAINLRLANLPTGWTVVAPAQSVVRPPVAPAATQDAAAGTMAACLGTSAAVVSGLFGSGSLPGQTSLVQSPEFQSAAGSSFEMGSRTAMLSSAGVVQAFDAIFTNAKFVPCYQQYQATLVAAAVPGSSVQVQPVTLIGPPGVESYGVVSTYTVPGTGTEVVGDAFILGGRVVTELQPSTNGPSIPGAVFVPAFDAVAGRVAAASR